MTPSSSSDPGAAARARIGASADMWRRKLLDLTKRNKAVHFRPNRVSTITIVDELPAEAFRLLYLRERAMRFKATVEVLFDEAAPDRASMSGEPDIELDEDDDTPQLDFAPYDSASVGDKHTDDFLQTESAPEALDKSLRRIDEQARMSIEEQGVNTLFLALGMLHYTESPQSEQTMRAPLLLLPVELSRKSARSGFTIRAGDDEPMVNPALAEYLRRDHGIALPELPDSSTIPDDYDLQDFFRATAAATSRKAGWSLKSSIYLSLFSFQKFVMYKDLEVNALALGAHRLVRQLVMRTGDQRSGAVVGLPDEIRAMDLDRDYAPEATYQVVDADSSQLRAIAAAAKNHDLVIEGPPGTGKSQTITNLIAQALAAGKSVLFVAEKMAALSVVHDRLTRAGLGEFCLELHSTKANKRAVMKALAAALDASIQNVAATTTSTQRLPVVRASLTEYAKAVHTPHGSLGITPWRAYGEVGRVLTAPRVSYSGPIDGSTVSLELLDRTRRELADLAVAAADVGVPAHHPWRDTTKTLYTTGDQESVEEEARAVLRHLDDMTRRAAAVEEALNLPPVRTFADVDTAMSISQVLARSPGAPLAVLDSAAWNAPPADVLAIIERGRVLQAFESRVTQCVVPETLEQDHSEDVAHVARKRRGILGGLAFLDGRYRTIRKRWRAYWKPSYRGSVHAQIELMRDVERVRGARRDLDALTPQAQALFGGLWQGWRSDWDILANYVRWVVEFRQVCVRYGLAGKALAAATRREPDVSAVTGLASAATSASEALERLRGLVGWPARYLAEQPVESVIERVRGLVDHLGAAPRWAAFEAARRDASTSLGGEVLPAAMDGTVKFADLESAFLRAFWLRWLSAVVQVRPALERFHTLTHEQRVAEFQELDRRVLHENRGRLVGELRDRVQHRLRSPEVAEAMPHLRRELARQRGLSPLRKTLRNAGPAIRAIKPCFMMSPLTVAQLLDGSAASFDLAIFDEASQLPPEDAVGAILRTKQLVVVGDPKQLPPTNFFAVASGTSDAPLGDDGVPLYEDSESILEEFMGAGFPMSRLKWHYRSAHESLISFSNVQFYDSDLYTFPSVERGTATSGLQFEFVEGGVYEGKGLNLVEARRVADEVARFAKEQLERRSAGEKGQSLGVGTFNLRQQIAIQDELEQRRRDDPSIEPFFDRSADEPFFVKNLENIQGDERDVIFLSVTYARALDGRLRYNFGPLNGENGWRRLNVLTTRARHRMRVFSSMRADEISPTGTTARGALLLREFLLFAERGKLESALASTSADVESPFEWDVLQELLHRGLVVVPQVGAAGYRVDLGVVDQVSPGRFLCGIECDGVTYHASETARDRDRLRQQVLESRGWTIHRVWSTDWFKDRKGQIQRLLELVEKSRRRALDATDAERVARERSLAEAARRESEVAEAARRDTQAVSATADVPYERPAASPYVVAPGAGRYASQDLLQAPESRIVLAILTVIEAESPIHLTDLTTRVAAMWSARAGSRIAARIHYACAAVVQAQSVHRRGPFLWSAAATCVVRSRSGTRIPADRIAPEEYAEAVVAVLRDGHGFTKEQLTNEVRAVFGFGRTGAALDEAISHVIGDLLASGRLGEGSSGIRLRT